MSRTRPRFLSDYDLHLLGESTHYRAWERLGAHLGQVDGVPGTWFAVWAPNAKRVSVVGSFNRWNRSKHPLEMLGQTGIWEGFVPGVGQGAIYKYAIRSRLRDYEVQKADPYAFYFETRPRTASAVWSLAGYDWRDAEWMATRAERNSLSAPINIYEVHLGSWMRAPNEGNRPLTYREAAHALARYVREMGYTHVELMPITEHPFDGSWGYQTLGYFAPTSRFGTPQDFMYFVDVLHRNGIGVLLDWVPAHFPRDEHGLAFFDGTHLYEHADPRQGEHQDWGTLVFNYGRRQVSNLLISSALFWLEVYHLDGLRVDAVASMLYLDYSRKPGEWIPNQHGGRENLEAVEFLRRFNTVIHERHPDVLTIAEESTSWPLVSRPTHLGGLGFSLKWNMGWMHDTLEYMKLDPIHRKFHHGKLTFGLFYAFHENFLLPFSHDEVVHGKGSMIRKMAGDEWQRFASLRLLYGYLCAHPGKKLTFMGLELGQWREWSHERALDWHLLEQPLHGGLQRWVRDANAFLRAEPALHELDFTQDGFEWIDCNDNEQSVIAFLRWPRARRDALLAICNFTPVPRSSYRIGVPRGGFWKEALNSDAAPYHGSGQGNLGGLDAEPLESHGRPYSLCLTLPPLSIVMLRSAAPAGT